MPGTRTVASAVLTLALLPGLPGCRTTRGSVPADAVAVEVGGVGMDPHSQTPVLLLEESEGERTLPIWIGFPEARSIASGLEGTTPVRPNTHDLAERVILGLEATVERVVVTELKNDTYYAVLVLRIDGDEIAIDSRPSDAIAIAVRADAPVFVRESVFDDSSGEAPEGEPEEEPGEPI